jgi:hypothetical protein
MGVTTSWGHRGGRQCRDLDNAPMRAVNARLGYESQPDSLILRRMLSDAMMMG